LDERKRENKPEFNLEIKADGLDCYLMEL